MIGGLGNLLLVVSDCNLASSGDRRGRKLVKQSLILQWVFGGKGRRICSFAKQKEPMTGKEVGRMGGRGLLDASI